MSAPHFNAWNGFAATVALTTFTASTGATAALAGATCTAWMDVSADTNAAKTTGAPTGTVTETTTAGTYTVAIEGSAFDPAVCDGLFPESVTPYLHIRDGSDVRIAIKCKYVRNRIVVAS